MVSIKQLLLRVLKGVVNRLDKTDTTSLFFTKDRFKGKKFEIGEYTYGYPSVYFENDESNLYIGKFCSIATEVIIFLGGNHRYDWITTYPFNELNEYFPAAKDIKGHPSTNGDVVIGNDVWIGHGVTILSGVKIADGAVIGLKSVVTKDVGAYEIWAGNPAKFIKKRFNDETIEFLLNFKWWNKDLEFISKNINLLCSNVNPKDIEWKME
jgi:acetyltransferase-like isoleucine patch superfamily enzyme